MEVILMYAQEVKAKQDKLSKQTKCFHKYFGIIFVFFLALFWLQTRFVGLVFGFEVEVIVQQGHTAYVRSVAISPDGKFALSGSVDNTLKLWDISTGREIRTLKGHTSQVRSVVFTPDGKFALSGSYDDTIKLWDILTGMEIRTFIGHSPCVHSVAISPDGKYALSGGGDIRGKDTTMRLWDISTGKEIRKFRLSEWVKAVAFSPDGRYGLSSSGNKLKLWDISTGREVRSFRGHSIEDGYNDISSVAFSPDGRYAVSASDGEEMKLWDISTGREVRSYRGGHTWNHINSVAFTPDGMFVLFGTGKSIKLWDVSTGNIIRTFKKPAGAISVAISPDGKYALSGGYGSREDDASISLWNISTGKEIITKGRFGNSPPITEQGSSMEVTYSDNPATDGNLIRVKFKPFPYATDPYVWYSYNKLKDVSGYVLRVYPENGMDVIRDSIKACKELKLLCGDQPGITFIRDDEKSPGHVLVKEAKQLLKPTFRTTIENDFFSKGRPLFIIVDAKNLPQFVDIPTLPGTYYIEYSLIFLNVRHPRKKFYHPNYNYSNETYSEEAYMRIRWGPPKAVVLSGKIANIQFEPSHSMDSHAASDPIKENWELSPHFWAWIKYLLWASIWSPEIN